MSIPVDLNFDDNGEPTLYVTECGKYAWRYEDTTAIDWKDNEEVERVTENTKDPLELFDGSDAIIITSESDMITLNNL